MRGEATKFKRDLREDADGKNTAWLVADNALYSVDLMTGKATASGKVEGASGPIRDITVLTKM
jgi:hypothetical protein